MSITGVNEAIAMLNGLTDVRKINKGLYKLAQYGVEQARSNLQEFSFYNSPNGLIDSIAKEAVSPYEVAVNADGGYATFVEYGTGIRGQNAPHPEVPMNWVYDSNNHGESGWWYPSETQPPEGQPQRFDAEKNIWYAWTKGLESHPFMYKTAQELKEIAAETIESELVRK